MIKNNTVVNVVLWDGESEWSPDNGVAIPAADGVGIGWSYADGVFTAPPAPQPTPEDISAANIAKSKLEYERATASIVALNEQIEDADYAGTTEAEVSAELTAWTDYRKQLRTYIKAGDGSDALPPPPAN